MILELQKDSTDQKQNQVYSGSIFGSNMTGMVTRPTMVERQSTVTVKRGVVSVTNLKPGMTTFAILSLNGRIMVQKECSVEQSTASFSLNSTSDLVPGRYVLRIRSNRSQYFVPFVA